MSDQIVRMSPERRHEIQMYQNQYRLLLDSPDLLGPHAAEFDGVEFAPATRAFFCTPERMQKHAEIIMAEYSDEKQRVIAACADICRHCFSLLGTEKLELGDNINWHCDHRTGYEWPNDVDFLRMERGAFDILVGKNRDSEIKYPWDLSNLMWLPSLVVAFYLTGDQRYSTAINNDLTDWCQSNPPPLGVNWFCPMNIGMRAVNLVITLVTMEPHLSDQLRHTLKQQLMMHGIVISGYLEIEKEAKRNNHYLANLVGLHYLGTLFQNTELGQDWLRFAERELEEESQYQFNPDGTSFEDSTSYHRLSTEMLLICAVLGRSNQREFSRDYLERLHQAIRFTADITPHHGQVPQVGDNDNGRMVQFCGFATVPLTDHRHLLALGGEFFDDPDLRAGAVGLEAEAIWYLGKFGNTKEPTTNTYCFAYPDGGYYGVKSSGIQLLIHNGRISPYCRGGHAHEDQLSFTLSSHGRDILVDPGSYRYSSDQQARNEFRSVGYHNTLQVNSSPMHFFDRDSFEGLWWMADRALATTQKNELIDGHYRFEGTIQSYVDSDGYELSRSLDWNTQTSCLSVTDQAIPSRKGRDSDVVFSRFLFAPEISPVRIAYRALALRHGDTIIAGLESESPTTNFLLRRCWFSPEYGRVEPCWQLQICWSPANAQSVTTRIELEQR